MGAASPQADLVEKSAVLLEEGDVIVAPDGSEHEVTLRYKVDASSVTIHTDTGLRLDKTGHEARTHVYGVKRRRDADRGSWFSVAKPVRAASDLRTIDEVR